jgi:hypothetical protein
MASPFPTSQEANSHITNRLARKGTNDATTFEVVAVTV